MQLGVLYTSTHNCRMPEKTSASEILRELMAEREVSEYALAKATGVPQPTINRILSGETQNPQRDTLQKLGRYFGRSSAQMAGEANFWSIKEPGTIYQSVPIVGDAQLGPEGFWYDGEHPVGHGDGFIDTPTTDANAYSICVHGDSMAPAIRNGWYVVIEPNSPLQQGEFVLVKTKDGRSMVKELLWERNGVVSLMSINIDYGRVTFKRDEIEKIHHVAFIAPPSKRKLNFE